MRILIVAVDSPTDRQLVTTLESRFRDQAKFRTADNLETASNYLGLGAIDCVVLDTHLPETAGREAFQKLLTRYPDVPLVIVSHKDRLLALELVKAGAADYLHRDTDPQDIFDRIQFAVERSHFTVRMNPDDVLSVKRLERAKAAMMNAYETAEPEAIRDSAVATASAVADISRKMFTELQSLSTQFAQQRAIQEYLENTAKTLVSEVLEGAGSRPSMRTQLEMLEHRIHEGERKISQFLEHLEKRMDQEAPTVAPPAGIEPAH